MRRKSMIKYAMSTVLCVGILLGLGDGAAAAQSALTFDAEYYYNEYPDLQAAIGNDYDALYQHYVTYGMKEGRSGSEEFNCLTYRSNYPDLKAAFGRNYEKYCEHYEKFGRTEGRDASVLLKKDAAEETLLGSYSTNYDATLSRAENVRVSAGRINGVVLEPGESFSFSDTVLPRTAENGYVPGEVISGGRFVLGTGGGICQTSSTLYAAMVDAGLPATERHPHSLPVDYISRDLESAIATGYKDLKFDNIYDSTLKITAVADDETGVLTVSLYLE